MNIFAFQEEIVSMKMTGYLKTYSVSEDPGEGTVALLVSATGCCVVAGVNSGGVGGVLDPLAGVVPGRLVAGII